jgi:hypothetical protein
MAACDLTQDTWCYSHACGLRCHTFAPFTAHEARDRHDRHGGMQSHTRRMLVAYALTTASKARRSRRPRTVRTTRLQSQRVSVQDEADDGITADSE